jgi:O-antigen/teichoic acid export membrane protein
LGIARSLTAIAGKLDVLLLVSLSGPTEAGIYALAAKIIAIYPLLSGSFSNVIAPRLSAISQKNELWAFIKKVIAGTFFFISTVFFMIIVAEPFIRILFGEKFSESIPVFRLLLVSMIFFVGSVPSVSVAIYYLKKPWILTVNSVIQVVIVFVGNILTIPIYGRFAPAYVSIVAFGFTWFLTSMLSFSYLKKHHER